MSRVLPPWPTKAIPGTKQKMDVIIWRELNGFLLFHPDDARMDQMKTVRRPIIRDDNRAIIGWEVVEDGHEEREERWSEDWDFQSAQHGNRDLHNRTKTFRVSPRCDHRGDH